MLFFAALLLVLNDHVLKGAGILPAVVTGKLSDVCGVFLLPIVIVRLARIDSRRAHALVCVACAIVFALVKTTLWANALYGAVLGHTLTDPTDLVALPAAAGAYFALGMPRVSRTWRDRVTLVFAGLGCMATSAQRPPMDPSLRPQPAAAVAQSAACAVVSTTGIEPLGQTANVHFTARNVIDTDCELDLTTDVTAKTDVTNAEVTVRGQTSVTIPAHAIADVIIAVRGAYPITCAGEPLVNWNVVETGPVGNEYRGPGGGRSTCWKPPSAIAP